MKPLIDKLKGRVNMRFPVCHYSLARRYRFYLIYSDEMGGSVRLIE